ncbi:uncharacterized protein LOC144928988 [Branchiostoma floridae x Branchiostoma belcheri]
MGTSESKPKKLGCACLLTPLRKLRRKNNVVSNFVKVETPVATPSTPKPGLFARLKRSTLPPGVILVESANAPRPRPAFKITWSSEEDISELDSEISEYGYEPDRISESEREQSGSESEPDQISGSEQDQISGSEQDQISGSEQDQISGSAEQDQIEGSEQDQISGSAEQDQISGSDAGEIPAPSEMYGSGVEPDCDADEKPEVGPEAEPAADITESMDMEARRSYWYKYQYRSQAVDASSDSSSEDERPIAKLLTEVLASQKASEEASDAEEASEANTKRKVFSRHHRVAPAPQQATTPEGAAELPADVSVPSTAEEQEQSRERQGVRRIQVAEAGDGLPPVA